MKTKNKITFISNSKNSKTIFKRVELFFNVKKLILNIFEKNNNLNENLKTLSKKRIKKILLLNLFFSFYEDLSRNLMNLNIKNVFPNDSYNFLNFEVKNQFGHNFQIPDNEKYFAILKNSSFHGSFRDKGWKNNWNNWTEKNFNRVKIYINNLCINNFLKNNENVFFKNFIQFTNKKIRKIYYERNNFNHSFEKWFDKSFDTSQTEEV